jgi:hypothetical protein|tara:strand:- start:236 stop:622 length:387 start_codon:yes stop_codon:yes gene_type:complete
MMQNKNNVEKKMSAKDDMSLAKDIKDIEFDVMQDLADSIKADFLKERSEGQSFTDWLQTKPDSYFERLSLKEGGSTVISFSEYAKKKPKIKKINLADHFKLNQTVADLSDADVELVNRLLKMSLGKED